MDDFVYDVSTLRVDEDVRDRIVDNASKQDKTVNEYLRDVMRLVSSIENVVYRGETNGGESDSKTESQVRAISPPLLRWSKRL